MILISVPTLGASLAMSTRVWGVVRQVPVVPILTLQGCRLVRRFGVDRDRPWSPRRLFVQKTSTGRQTIVTLRERVRSPSYIIGSVLDKTKMGLTFTGVTPCSLPRSSFVHGLRSGESSLVLLILTKSRHGPFIEVCRRSIIITSGVLGGVTSVWFR